jgi:Ty3 transposon capsid-like protein
MCQDKLQVEIELVILHYYSLIIMTSKETEKQPQPQSQKLSDPTSSVAIATIKDKKREDLKQRMRRLTFGAAKGDHQVDDKTIEVLQNLFDELVTSQTDLNIIKQAEKEIETNHIDLAANLLNIDSIAATNDPTLLQTPIKNVKDRHKTIETMCENMIQNQELILQNQQYEHKFKEQTKQIEELTAGKQRKNKRQSVGGQYSTGHTGLGSLKPHTFLQQDVTKSSKDADDNDDEKASKSSSPKPAPKASKSIKIQKDSASSSIPRNNQEEEEEEIEAKDQDDNPEDDDDDDDDDDHGGGGNPPNNDGTGGVGGRAQPRISNKSLVAKPLYFTADEDTSKPGALTIEVWMGSVIDYLTVNNVPKRLQVITAASYLAGSARAWWNSFQLEFYNSNKGFNEFKDALFDQFRPYDIVNNSIQMLRRLFMGTKFPTVQLYISEFGKLIIRIPINTMNEQARIVMFTEGLTIDIRTALIHGNYTTLRAVQAAAVRIENQLKPLMTNRNVNYKYQPTKGSFNSRGRGRGGRGRGGYNNNYRSNYGNNSSYNSTPNSTSTTSSTTPSAYQYSTSSNDNPPVEGKQFKTYKTAIQRSIDINGKAKTDERIQNDLCLGCGKGGHRWFECSESQQLKD